MAVGDKPYRLYRGGRKKGKVPLSSSSRPPTQPASTKAPKRRRRWGLWVALAVVGLLLLAVLWGALGYRAFASGVDEANKRLPKGAKAQLAKRDRSLLSEPTTVLVIGTDGGRAPGRGDANRSDSLLLLHLDPGRTASPTSRSHATSAWRSPATGRRRSTQRTRSAGRR